MYSRKIDNCENKSIEYTKLGFNFKLRKLYLVQSLNLRKLCLNRCRKGSRSSDGVFYHQISNPLRIIEYASAEKMYHIGVGKLMAFEIRAGLVAMVS